MQRIPFYSLADFFRDRKEMETFRKERKVVRDEKVITAVKCPTCGKMVEDMRGHPCLTI